MEEKCNGGKGIYEGGGLQIQMSILTQLKDWHSSCSRHNNKRKEKKVAANPGFYCQDIVVKLSQMELDGIYLRVFSPVFFTACQ